MTDRIKAMLDEAARTGEPGWRIDDDAVVVKGRKRLWAKRVGLAGGATFGVAAVTAVALVLAPLATGTVADERGGADGVEQPVFALPDIDSGAGARFEWLPEDDGAGGPTAETGKFDAAFWKHIDDSFDEVGVRSGGDAPIEPLSEADRPAMTRDLMLVNRVEDDRVPEPAEHEPIPWYRLQTTVSLDRPGVTDHLDVTVHPKGSFEAGPGEEYGYRNLYTCDHRDAGPQGHQPPEADRVCTDTTGPDGERITLIKTEYRIDGETSGFDMRIAVFRPDGTAITVRDWGAARIEDGDQTGAEDPALDFDQLTDLALALPDDVRVG